MEALPKTVLVVDDEEPFLLSLADGLAPFAPEFRVVTATSGEAALELVDRLIVDLVVTDLRMPDVNGLDLIRLLRLRQPHVPVVVMTAFKSTETEADLAEFPLAAVLEKPLEFEEFVNALRAALFPGRERRPGGFTAFLAALVLLVFAACGAEARVAAGGCVPDGPAAVELGLGDAEWRFAPCSDPRV